MSKKLKLQDFIDIATARGGKCISSEYIRGKAKMDWGCHKGHRWSATGEGIRAGFWCKECAGTKRYTLDDAKKLAISRDGLCLSTEYINNKAKLLWKCNKDGYQWKAAFSNLLNNAQWCPMCSGNLPRTLNDAKALALSKNGECLSDRFINVNTQMIWKCNIDGYIWSTTFNCINSSGDWCAVCAGIKQKDIYDIITLLSNKAGKIIHVPEYINSKSIITIKCELDGFEWKTTYNAIQIGRWCPLCAKRVSRQELEVYNYIKHIYIDAIGSAKGLFPGTRFELDIYIPSIKIAIEYDGTFWHKSSWAIKHGAKIRDAKKDLLCIENNIKLIRIDEDDYVRNPKLTLKNLMDRIELILSENRLANTL